MEMEIEVQHWSVNSTVPFTSFYLLLTLCPDIPAVTRNDTTSLPPLPLSFTLSLPHKCSHSLSSFFVGVTFSLAVNHSFHLRETLPLFHLTTDLLIASICPSPPALNYNQGIKTEKKEKKRKSWAQRWNKSKPGGCSVCVSVFRC